MRSDASYGEAITRAAQRVDHMAKRATELGGLNPTDYSRGQIEAYTHAEDILREEYQYALDPSRRVIVTPSPTEDM